MNKEATLSAKIYTHDDELNEKKKMHVEAKNSFFNMKYYTRETH